ncbi:MAG: YbaN family protein [Pseudomonadota bacterium]
MAQSKRVKRSRRARILYRWLAIAAAGLGIAGLILPLVPGTVFAIIAAWAASRSSPTLHLKIRRNRYLGPVIQSWENGRTIPNYAKALAVFFFCLSLTKLWWFGAPAWLLYGMSALFVVLTLYMLSRPSPEAYERRLAAAASQTPLAQQPGPVNAEHEQQRQSSGQQPQQ